MHDIKMFDRPGPLDTNEFQGSGADWLEQFKPLINDGQTIVCSPHKVYGPQSNDLVLQLRKRRIEQVILAGMSANLCVESHLRELLEQGFEVAVVVMRRQRPSFLATTATQRRSPTSASSPAICGVPGKPPSGLPKSNSPKPPTILLPNPFTLETES